MAFEHKIYIICGNPRSGKTTFAKFIQVNKKEIINTTLETLIKRDDYRFIFNIENKKKKLIDYFYTKRYVGNIRENKYTFADFFEKNILNDLITNFKTLNNNFSKVLIEFILQYAIFLKKDLMLLDLNMEFFVEKFFKKKQIILLYFSRNYKEIIYEVLIFKKLTIFNNNVKSLIEKIFIIYYLSSRKAKLLSVNQYIQFHYIDYNKLTDSSYTYDLEKIFNLKRGLINNYFSSFKKIDNYIINNQIELHLKEKFILFDKIISKNLTIKDYYMNILFFAKFKIILLTNYLFHNNTLYVLPFIFNPFKFVINLFKSIKLFFKDNI